MSSCLVSPRAETLAPGPSAGPKGTTRAMPWLHLMAALSIAHAHRVPYAPLHARQHLRHALKGQVAPRHSPGVVSINVAWRPGLTPGPFHRVSEPSHRPPSARLAQEHRRPRHRVRTRGLLPLTGFPQSVPAATRRPFFTNTKFSYRYDRCRGSHIRTKHVSTPSKA